MRPSRNAFIGYSYQKTITFLMLAKMDVEREINEIEIEAIVDNNFDDIKISIDNSLVYCQIKDIDNISFNDLRIEHAQILIKGKEHKLATGINLLFFKEIDIICNTKIIGIPAYKISNIYIIPLSREKTGKLINNLYKNDARRESFLNQFFNSCIDEQWHLIE